MSGATFEKAPSPILDSGESVEHESPSIESETSQHLTIDEARETIRKRDLDSLLERGWNSDDSNAIAHLFLEEWSGDTFSRIVHVAANIEHFSGLDDVILDTLITNLCSSAVAEHSDRFSDSDPNQVADKLIAANFDYQVMFHIENFPNLAGETVQQLKERAERYLRERTIKFNKNEEGYQKLQEFVNTH